MPEQKNRAHGKIEKLPDSLKRDVENMLLDGETYQNISDYLKDKGEDVHFSSVGRYGRNFLNRFESVRIAKEFAKMLAEDNVDRPPTELHEANNLIASQLIMEALVDDGMDAKEKSEMAKSIATLQRAQVANEKLKIDARKESGAVHIALNIFKDKIFEEISSAHPELAKQLMALADETEAEMDKV